MIKRKRLWRPAMWALACMALVLSGLAAGQNAPVFRDGFEPTPPTTLVVHYPAGEQSITARGNGGGLSLGHGVPFQRNGDTFTLVLGEIEAPVSWKPLLDDATFALGPDFVVAPGETLEVWPRFTTNAGEVVTLFAAFESPTLGNVRPIYAYLPPTYIENPYARFPVVYMHDGQNLWAARPELAFGGVTWEVDSAFDEAASTGAFTEAIVIGVASTGSRLHEYTPTFDATYKNSGGADQYLLMLASELKPAVDSALRTRPDRSSTLMTGSGLGGLVTAYAGREMPDVFGRIAALSPASWWDDAVIVSLVQTTPATPDRPLLVYVDSGDTGASSDHVATTTQLAQAYQSVGFISGSTLIHLVQLGGQHNEVYWAQRFPGAMQFLIGPAQ